MCKYCNLFPTGEGKPRESFDHCMGVPVNGVPLTVADMDKVGDHDRLAYPYFRHIIVISTLRALWGWAVFASWKAHLPAISSQCGLHPFILFIGRLWTLGPGRPCLSRCHQRAVVQLATGKQGLHLVPGNMTWSTLVYVSQRPCLCHMAACIVLLPYTMIGLFRRMPIVSFCLLSRR